MNTRTCTYLFATDDGNRHYCGKSLPAHCDDSSWLCAEHQDLYFQQKVAGIQPVWIPAPSDVEPTGPREPIRGDLSFERELASLINRHSKENGSNTPDFILAHLLTQTLEYWNQMVSNRDAKTYSTFNCVRLFGGQLENLVDATLRQRDQWHTASAEEDALASGGPK